MAKEEEKVNEESKEIEVLQTVKETGLGIRMPDGKVLDCSFIDPGLVEWMSWVTQKLDKIEKNIA